MYANALSWWQTGVIYQIYPRSFKDMNGDGVGDLQGVIEKLDYLNDGSTSSLGVDAIWLSPFYPSPMADFGYDVSDYCDVHPMFGDLATFDRLVHAAHQRKIKIIIDFVPNHSSDQHPWFQESRSSRDNPKRDWYLWRDARPDGSPPNNWGSMFGGPAWEWDERTGQYYFHHFLKEQPDLNWRNAGLRQAMMDVLRFWLERGVDGFRMDVVGMILKDPSFRDNPLWPELDPNHAPIDLWGRQQNIYNQDLDEVHEIIRDFRRLLDEYPERCAIGEVWSELPRWVKYYGEGGSGLHLPFNFRLIDLPWQARRIQGSVDDLEKALPAWGWPNYVLGSHDKDRLATRIGAPQTRLAAMLLLTLRGTPTLYYGDELGLENGIIPPEQIQDPQGLRLGAARSRDYCRTPMQWDDSAYAGFSTSQPWLPLSADYPERNVSALAHTEHSLLNLYKQLIWLRKRTPALHAGAYQPLETEDPHCFAYLRSDASSRFLVALNFGSMPARLQLPDLQGGTILLSTSLARTGKLPQPQVDLDGKEGLIIELPF